MENSKIEKNYSFVAASANINIWVHRSIHEKCLVVRNEFYWSLIPWFGQSLYFLVGIQKFPVLMQGNEGHNSFIFADKNLSTLMLIL